MPPTDLHARVADLPTEPGVYLFRDGAGRVLYVGKARNLRARVRQYFGGHDGRIVVPFLVDEAADVDFVLVRTEKEALLLENTLIKKHRPRYNARLVDDKNFLHLRIDPRMPWPRHTLVRRIQDDGARYFGPFHSASSARHTLEAVHRTFPLRSCSDRVLASRTRPCLLFQMHRCLAPCVGRAEPGAYARLVEDANLFLAGRTGDVLAGLRERMTAEAEAERFEEAAGLRDLIRDIEATVERQQVVDARLADRDAWGVYREGDRGVAAVIPVRQGFMQEPAFLVFEGAVEEDGELLSALLNRHYEALLLPPEVVVPTEPPDREALEEVLSERRGRKVHLAVPMRGDRVRLVDLARRNAEERFKAAPGAAGREAAALDALARVARLPGPPHRIECFDNSNLGGTDPVSSMVVFLDGRPDRSEYRRYRVRTVGGSDDYATMREILDRRLRRAARTGVFPDLLVVDGGRGQVGVARAVLEDLGYPSLPLLGLAKPRTDRRKGARDAVDRIVLPDARDPVVLRSNDAALRLLQRLRDESHRHAVEYHRRVRTRRNLLSVLVELPGVGAVRARALLRHFGSARRLVEASETDIADVPGFGAVLAGRIRIALDRLAREADRPEEGPATPDSP